MVEGKSSAVKLQGEFESAIAALQDTGNPGSLRRWFDRSLDADGLPDRLAVSTWRDFLKRLADLRQARNGDWPEELDARIEGWFRQALRFSRPDGSPVFGVAGPQVETKSLFRYWAENLADPGLDTVVRWWFPTRERPSSPPPLPAAARLDVPFAMLRSHWQPSGDFVAIDHRQSGPTSSLEVFAAGQSWLGPDWTSNGQSAAATPAAMSTWVSNSTADLAEWTFRVGDSRVRRQALVMRGRRLALLADDVEGSNSEMVSRFALREGVAAKPLQGSRAIALESKEGRPAVRLLPLGLSDVVTVDKDGSFASDGKSLVLKQTQEGKKGWLPLLISWDPLRNRKNIRWRRLTVTERGEVCSPSTAAAVRVTWGRDETLVIYRSLARPSNRAFLGHQTRARLLVGLFDREGNLTPIFTVEE